MTINEWFLRNNKYPLIVISVLLIIVQAFLILYYLKSNEENQVRSIKNMIVDTATVGIQQKNRPLIESTFHMAIDELGAKLVLLCDEGKILYSFPVSYKNCNDIPKPKLFEKLIHSKVSGFKGYSYYFYIPRFRLGNAFIWVVTVPLLFLLVSLFLIYRLQRKFNDDILQPLEKGLLTEEKFIISSLNELQEQIKRYQGSKEKAAVASAIVEERFKISHNIRSLFQSITCFQSSISSVLTETKRQQFRHIITGLKGILIELVNDNIKDFASLDNPKAGFKEHIKQINLSHNLVDLDLMIRSFISQKQNELQSMDLFILLKYESHKHNAFVEIPQCELKSILSNLVNNSLDAGASEIRVTLNREPNGFSIEIFDDGKGVPMEIEKDIFERDFSFGKKNGTGYGLYHAKMFLQSWNGCIKLKKSDDKGACFKLDLPVWEPISLKLESGATVVILDDDEKIHDIWRKKLSSIGKELDIKNFYTPKQFRKWFVTNENISLRKEQFFFFIDSNLGEGLERGEQLIQNLGLEERSVLVSHRFDDLKTLNFCKQYNINLLPKSLLDSMDYNNGFFSLKEDVS